MRRNLVLLQAGGSSGAGGFTEETEKTALRCLSGKARCFFSDSTERREWGSKEPCGVDEATLLEEGQHFAGFTTSEGTERGNRMSKSPEGGVPVIPFFQPLPFSFRLQTS